VNARNAGLLVGLALLALSWIASLPAQEAPERADVGRSDLSGLSGLSGILAPDGSFERCPESLELLVERGLARGEGLEVGQRVRLGAAPDRLCDATVRGIFQPPPDPAALARGRPRVLLHVPDLAALSGRVGEVDRFSVRLRDGTDPDSIAALIGALIPGARVLPAASVAASSSATFEVIRRFHKAIAIITLTASGVFLACIMTLKVQERRVQASALRLVGVSHRTLFGWLLVEATIISVLGGVAGLGIGQLASTLINGWYQRVYDTQLVFSLVTRDTLALGLVLAVLLGLGAGAVATLGLLRVAPLDEAGR